jgi:hypothetical protein
MTHVDGYDLLSGSYTAPSARDDGQAAGPEDA